NGEDLGHGACQLSFDAETAVVTPAGGLPVAFDLGDVDRTAPADWDLKLTLYTGASVTLQQFGAAFSDMSRELLAAWRDRTVRCLLLEDLEELGRFNGAADGGPGEIRIYKSNIAFLPQAGSPVQWRLAEVDSIAFDDASYSIALTRGSDRLVLSKVAKKTDEVLQKLRRGAWSAAGTGGPCAPRCLPIPAARCADAPAAYYAGGPQRVLSSSQRISSETGGHVDRARGG